MSGMSKADRRNADYYAGLTSYPSPGGVSEQDQGMGFFYTPDPYPTREMAPARYAPGMDYPFGFDPEGYTGDPLLGLEPEEKVKREEEEEDKMPKGSYKPETPQSTNMFGQPIPRASITSPRGYGTVSAPSQWGRDERYVGGSEFGKSSLESFAGLLTEAMTGYSPKIGKQNIARFSRVKQYPSLFDYV